MKTFTIATQDGANPFPLAVPTCWADVTLAQFIRLITEPDTHPLCALTTLTPEQLDALHTGDVALLSARLDFTANTTELTALTPSVDLPEVGKSTYGQLLLATQHLQAHEGQPDLLAAPYLYALYRSQQISGKYDEQRLEQMQAAVLAAPVTEVYADVVFILAAWQHFTSATLPTQTMLPTRETTPTMNLMPELRTWARGLGRLPRWIRSAGATRSNTRGC
jgi:hypothetical protein